MSEDVRGQTVEATARRRLIRGAFAAPAALTLWSGSAFAAASNLRCISNQLTTPALPGASGMTDTWVRVQLWTLGSGATLSTWVSGADIVALTSSATPLPYLSSSEWQAFTAGSNSGYTVGQKLTSPPTKQGSTLTHNGSYVAVRVDSTGKIIGVVAVDPASGGTAVAQTCWASFSGIRFT